MRAARCALPLLLAPAIAQAADCAGAAQCNRVGSDAYGQGRYADATASFLRQLDFAETAQREADDGADPEPLDRARDVALNNLALAALKSAECGRARAWIDLARADARATIANRRAIDAGCPAVAAPADPIEAAIGEYWQYAGHGAWNRIVLHPTGDETLRVEAFWQRIARGPLDVYGLAAFGELDGAYVHVDAAGARGVFEGLDPAVECTLRLSFVAGGLEVVVEGGDDCHTGGAGAYLGGPYRKVDDQVEAEADGGN